MWIYNDATYDYIDTQMIKSTPFLKIFWNFKDMLHAFEEKCFRQNTGFLFSTVHTGVHFKSHGL